MVKVRNEHRVTAEGRLDRAAWLKQVSHLKEKEARDLIEQALQISESSLAEGLTAHGETCFEQSLKMAELLIALRLDAPTIAASLVIPAFIDSDLTVATLEKSLGDEVVNLVEGTVKMNALSTAGQTNKATQQDGLQLDKLRKMILAMAEDVRVVLIKLAEHLCCLRTVKNCNEQERCRVAQLTRDIFAPLANRLGVGQIKWEMEDLAFRYLQPAIYKRVAKLLDERRVDRERYLTRVLANIREALQTDGVVAEVNGRVKHIFSIWRKMHRKNIDYDEVYDVRAVRITVHSVQECYSALGTVHRLWQHIPKEFDDYIATPKENGYRSLHTAVLGPEGKTVEVQIRTHEMHQESELGVAAHWRYKEGGQRDIGYENKIAWLRQLLDWQDEVADASDFMDELKNKVRDERVYVLTPKGDVIDLPLGATPLDFAYSVHTSVGHRCRGAKIDGRIVPLTTKLQTGERIDVITGPLENPSRDWLNANLGYVRSSRSRSKIQQWFKLQDKDKNIAQGRAIMDKELQRLGVQAIDFSAIAHQLNFTSGEDILAAVCTGDIKLQQILNAANITIPAKEDSEVIPFNALRPAKEYQPDEITIQGVGNLLTTLAQCCRPLPGDPIMGYITQGRGVSIHRQDCSNMLNVNEERQQRLIDVEWGGGEKTYPVAICIEAYERSNLLRDVTACLANDKVNVISLNSTVDKHENKVLTYLTIEVADLSGLTRVLDRLNQLPNVLKVHRQS